MTKNDDWEKIGDDFFYTNYITYDELLNDVCQVPHPDGALSVKYPEEFDSSKPMRVRGKGFRRERIGDMYVKNIVKFKRKTK
jgi:DnaJ-class molecular chaperone